MRRKRKSNPKSYLGYVLLILIPFFYYGKDSLYFNNGAGGSNWKIGQPMVNFMSAIGSHSLSEFQQRALLLVNRERQINGLPPLVEDPLITLTAQKHADDMSKRRFYAHVNPEGQSPSGRYRANGGIGGIGENINYYHKSGGLMASYGLLEVLQRSWMYSHGHRDNLLNPRYTKFGYGIAINSLSGEAYAVQDFQ